jgi:hypothetical protein
VRYWRHRENHPEMRLNHEKNQNDVSIVGNLPLYTASAVYASDFFR